MEKNSIRLNNEFYLSEFNRMWCFSEVIFLLTHTTAKCTLGWIEKKNPQILT